MLVAGRKVNAQQKYLCPSVTPFFTTHRSFEIIPFDARDMLNYTLMQYQMSNANIKKNSNSYLTFLTIQTFNFTSHHQNNFGKLTFLHV